MEKPQTIKESETKKAPIDPPVEVDPAVQLSFWKKNNKCKTFKEFLEQKGWFA